MTSNLSNFRLNVLLNHLDNRNCKFVDLQKTAACQYQYSQDDTILTKKMRDFYEINGYIVFPKLIEEHYIDLFREHFVNICNRKVDAGNIVFLKDKSLSEKNVKGEYLINKIQQLSYDPVFEKYITHPKLLDIIQSIIGPNIKAMHSMLINKPPDSGMKTSVHPLHQDLLYFPFRPPNRIVAAWTAMETITEENGCLYVLPGTHKQGVLHQHSYPDMDVNKGFHGVRGYDHYPKTVLRMEKGDTVFFHPLLIHGSGVNNSQRFRKAISCHFAATECHYINIQGTVQEQLGNEMVDMVEKKLGIHIEFPDYFRLNSRLVRGKEGTLN